MVGRRTFLQLLGIAPVAATVAPQALAGSLATGASSAGAMGAASLLSDGIEGIAIPLQSAAKKTAEGLIQKHLKDKAKYELLKTLAPDWWVDDLKDSAMRSAIEAYTSTNAYGTADPNILALKSVSIAGKISMHYDRRMKKAIEEKEFWLNYKLGKAIFDKANGIDPNEDSGDY